MTQSLTHSISSGSLQLGILLHQLLQAEAWKLYSNLGFFAFSFALIHRSITVLRMPHSLSRTKAALARGFFDGRRFRHRELLAPAGEELGNVLNRVVSTGRDGRLGWPSVPPAGISSMPRSTLIFILVRVMGRLSRVSRRARVGTGAFARPADRRSATSPRAHLLNQGPGHFLQKS